MVFLFASMVILRPLDLKISLTSCFVFSIFLALEKGSNKAIQLLPETVETETIMSNKELVIVTLFTIAFSLQKNQLL